MNLQLPSLGSRDIDGFLLRYHCVPQEQQEAYLQQLRNIPRLGFPSGLCIGRGAPARYAADQFFQLVVISELHRLRVPSAEAIKLIHASWAEMRVSVLTVWQSVEAAFRNLTQEIPQMFWLVPADRIHRVVASEGNYPMDQGEKITVVGQQEATDRIFNTDPRYRCHVFIHASKLVKDVFDFLQWGIDTMTPNQLECFMSGMPDKGELLKSAA